MIRRFAMVLLLAIAAGANAHASTFRITTSAGPRDVYFTNKALLIGVSKYDRKAGWEPLTTVPHDVELMKTALRRQGFEEADIEVVSDPSAERLRQQIKNFLLKTYKSDTRLFVFVAAHGWTDHKSTGYLLGVDAPSSTDGNFQNLSLGMDEISTWSERSAAKHILFVFDSCFSGAVFLTRGKANLPSELFLSDADRPVRQFITSGSDTEEVPAQSVFTEFLVDGLNGGADVFHDGIITANELGYWLKMRITPLGRQTPQYGTSPRQDFKRGDVMFQAIGAPASTPGVAGSRPIPLTAVAAAASRGEMKVLRELTKPDLLFDRINVFYYEKASDGTKVRAALDKANIPFLKTRATLPDRFEVNAVVCGDDIPIEAVRSLALALTNNGVPVRAIFPFRHPARKPRRIEIVSLSEDAAGKTSLASPPLTVEQIKALPDCRRWLRNH